MFMYINYPLGSPPRHVKSVGSVLREHGHVDHLRGGQWLRKSAERPPVTKHVLVSKKNVSKYGFEWLKIWCSRVFQGF